jgi:NosR/NirI family transcriptional regulator, nitrous oxide reductase regulator
MTRHFNIIKVVTCLLLLYSNATAEVVRRFPPPEFDSGYQLPTTSLPAGRADIYQYLDVIVLVTALSLSSYLVLKKRKRGYIFALMIFSLIYFGFWRKGCVCAIGSIQNIVLSFFDPSYSVPIAVILFFLLPLVFTVFFGRTFCAAVCPLGAVQDLVLIKPVSVPVWAENGLRLIGYIYLTAAVLFAATGSAFVICRYDPFVSFFRLNGNFNILILSACFLVAGLFIGRPYCRFFCPYGILLRQVSRIAKWHSTITPGKCIKCRLCEDSCPFGAIRKPAAQWPQQEQSKNKKTFVLLLALIPVLTLLGGYGGSRIKNTTARMHATIRLEERIRMEQSGSAQGTTDQSDAFRKNDGDIEKLYKEAADIRSRFALGGWILGGFLGLVIALKLMGVSVWREQSDYHPDNAGCVSCGRCFEYCPVEKQRRQPKSTFDITGEG